MIDEKVLSERIKRAIRYEPPSPGFGARPFISHGRQQPVDQLHWSVGLVAIVIAILIVVTLAFGVHRRAITLPARIPPVGSGSVNPACGLQSSSGTSEPIPEKMLSPTTGWARGALRTTDGAVHWLDVAPPSIPGRTSGSAEFFLDATHAWVAEAAGSSKACADHIVTFTTADGGRTWQQAAPIAVKPALATDVIWEASANAHWLYFIDARNGWLLIESGPFSIMSPLWNVGALYRTTDGGLHWNLISNNPGSAAMKAFGAGCHVGDGMTISSASTGWMPFSCPSGLGVPPGLLVTHDGGLTWRYQLLPMLTSEAPVVLDDRHATIKGELGGLLLTSDGGATWTSVPLPARTSLVTFINPADGWAIVNEAADPLTAWRLYRTSDGGATWTAVGKTLPSPIQAPYGLPMSLVFIDANNGFLALNGLLLRTTDGGRTWIEVQTVISKSAS